MFQRGGTSSVRQMDTIPDDGMANLTLQDSGANVASTNYFDPLIDMNVDNEDSLQLVDINYKAVDLNSGTNVPPFA